MSRQFAPFCCWLVSYMFDLIIVFVFQNSAPGKVCSGFLKQLHKTMSRRPWTLYFVLSSSAIWQKSLYNSCIIGAQTNALPEAWKCGHSSTDSEHSVDLCRRFNGLWFSSWCVSDSHAMHFPTRLTAGSDVGLPNILWIWAHGQYPWNPFTKQSPPPFIHCHSFIIPSFIRVSASLSHSILLTHSFSLLAHSLN